ncbi:MAG: methyl-accepting chemotaxis protein [Pirellulaceae bacterium]
MSTSTVHDSHTDIETLRQELAVKRSMADNSPINIILADTDLKITYVNPASVRTLKPLEKFLPCRVEDVLGQSIDIFHKDPAFQRRILAKDSNLPHRAIINIGDQKADLLVSPTYDDNGKYLGPMVTWEVVTEKLKLEQAAAEKNALVENAPINIMLADTDLQIRYLNPASVKTLKSIERLLPCRVEEMIGKSIDIFHKDPSYQRGLLANYRSFPRQAIIDLAGEKLDLLVSATYDAEGAYTGPMVTWSIVTERLKLEEQAVDFANKLAAIDRQQAVIEFKLDGTIVTANDNFCKTVGYALDEIKGQHHSMFAEEELRRSPEYKRFWEKLNRGEYDAGEYKRIGKGGKEVWIRASYNPICDASGKPLKVVKYASDITEEVRLRREQEEKQQQDLAAAAELQRKVEELMNVVNLAAQGDLTGDVAFEGEDAMGKLAGGFRKMMGDLRGIIGQVVEGSAQFAEGSQVIAENAQNLAQGAQTQSASVEEMSASIEELTRSIEAVKDNAGDANKVASETSAMAEEGGKAVQKSVEAMDLIKSSSEQISEIIQVISEIASQTNLLALNAAIEAARAGEHGLGFAVVADEVRKLAERSSEAAKEISSLIKESTQRVQDGANLSAQTGAALEKIIQGVEATADKIGEIATATVEQAANANEVANAIQQVSHVTEQSAAASEQMASSSEELGAQATSMRELVARFKVER